MTVVSVENSTSLLASFQVRSSLVAEIVRMHLEHSQLQKGLGKSKQGQKAKFQLRLDGTIVKQDRLYVPSVRELKDAIFREGYSSVYALRPGSTKMYRTMKKTYYWPRIKVKLSPRYIGPYVIIGRVGLAAYRLELSSELGRIHDVFHISILRKYVPNPSHILQSQPVKLREDLSYEEELMQILDRKEEVLRNKTISLEKVL
ncbi:Chromo domain-containing protein [Cucumis melo var. makuwa]|uniref:Chromo domain-containing protein n=1 Tax=Cucumis melo var. makuwa TaxID=1194695 RepID=A0A5D3BEC0_CUCMM|nr:Chromo domain-containing protein [Cucumis melo var. makuwa]